MIEELKTKILNWTPEAADQFHGSIKRQGDAANKIWEIVSDGIYIFSSDGADFFNNTTSYHLQFGDITDQLNLKRQMSEIANKNNFIKISYPDEIQTVLIDNIVYTYWKEQVPYLTQGVDFTSLLLNNNRSELAQRFIENLLIGLDQIIFIIDILGRNNNYPLDIQATNFYYDTVSQNYFWKLDFLLTTTRQNSIEVILNSINGLETFLNQCLKISIDNYSDVIKQRMEKSCKILCPAT